MSDGISRDEWLKAVDDVESAPSDPDALTSEEIGKMLGLGRSAAKERIRKLIGAQKAIRVSKAVRNSHGLMVRVPAYKLVKDAQAPRRRRT